jgi:hypothetical protein
MEEGYTFNTSCAIYITNTTNTKPQKIYMHIIFQHKQVVLVVLVMWGG